MISPDGKQIATTYWDEAVNPRCGVAILPIEGGPPTRRVIIFLDYDSLVSGFSWVPDGRAVLYIGENRANIWSQPIDGSKPTRLTDFQGDELFNFAYSRDG